MTAPPLMATHCYNCHGALGAGSRFCIHCGAAAGAAGSPAPPLYGYGCPTCGGDGSRLPLEKVYCSECRWLRPLGPNYSLDVNAFLFRLDADAMNIIRSIGPLTVAANAVSERVGRPWFEASVNGLRLSERQLPDIFAQAIRAARIMALPYLPELYISGDQMWDAATLGSDTSSFIVLGSVLVNFKPEELQFVLGREMGHCRAGHALWKTVMQFFSGRSQRRSIMGDGVLQFLNPAKLVENAVDAPLMAWARHAEITADRAGMLVVGKEDVARRVLMQWTLKSFPLQARINMDAWQEQEDNADEITQRVAEWTLSSTPFLAGRLKLLKEFAASEELRGWRRVIEHWAPPAPPTQAEPAKSGPAPGQRKQGAPPPPDPNSIRLVCVSCKEAMRIPKSTLETGEPVNVRCPNPSCRAVLTIKPKPAAAAPPAAPRPETLSE